MDELCLTGFQLVILAEELEQLIVERRPARGHLRVVDLHGDVASLQHQRQYSLIVHEDIRHANGVEGALEVELPMNDVTGIHILEVIVLQYFQIEHPPIKAREI